MCTHLQGWGCHGTIYCASITQRGIALRFNSWGGWLGGVGGSRRRRETLHGYNSFYFFFLPYLKVKQDTSGARAPPIFHTPPLGDMLQVCEDGISLSLLLRRELIVARWMCVYIDVDRFLLLFYFVSFFFSRSSDLLSCPPTGFLCWVRGRKKRHG